LLYLIVDYANNNVHLLTIYALCDKMKIDFFRDIPYKNTAKKGEKL